MFRWVLVGATPIAYKLYKEYKTPKPKGVPIGHYFGSFGGSTVIGLPHGRPLEHVHILGATGSGKTTMLANLAVNDMLSGNGFAVVDPKGDLVDTILRHVPDNRVEDIIVFDPADREHPLGFNILEYVIIGPKN